MPARPRQLHVLPCVIGLLIGSSGCNRTPAPGQGASGEDAPAPPCSVNGMLFRDTPDLEFEQCGSAEVPLTGAVGKCVREAMAEEQPFVVQLKWGTFTLPGRTPALVGAHFDGEFAVRTYMPTGEGEGERTTVDLILTKPDSDELSLMAKTMRPLRCRRASEPPSSPGYEVVAGDARHRFDAKACREWFDAKAWDAQPWDSRYDLDRVVTCAR